MPVAPAFAPSVSPAVLCAAQPLQPSGAGAHVPELVHLLPAGVIRTRDGRGPFRLADAAAVIARSLPAGGASLPIDENHSIDLATPKGGPSPARGWIVELQARADGVWGRVEWTPEGRALVASRAYRHVSPVIQCDAEGRVLRILRASVVNIPNLTELAALNASQTSALSETIMDLTKLREALALPADAGEAAILDAIAALVEKAGGANSLHAARPDPTKWVAIEDFQRAIAEANKLRQGVSLHAAEEQVASDIRKGVILPWMKDWAVELCMTSAPSYDRFIQGVGPGFSHLIGGQTKGRVLPAATTGKALSDEEKAVAARLGHTDDDFAAARG